MKNERLVILRDDDTNALTPPECLERLYRPFLDRKLPVNLATIPEVRTTAKTPQGQTEGFLFARSSTTPELVPFTRSHELTSYLRSEPGYRIVQHGCHHDPFEFDLSDPEKVRERIDRGGKILQESGLDHGGTFVAPHDKISRTSYTRLADQFQVVSTGWFEWRRIPKPWLLSYFWTKLRGHHHWRKGNTWLLSHPGCLLSYQRDFSTMRQRVRETIMENRLTVLVTHWWEYFREGKPDEAFISILHQCADDLASESSIRVIPFSDLKRYRSVSELN